MANFSYFYKTSDGVRHEAQIVARSKDMAFAELRKQGIRPIKVVQHEPPLVVKLLKRSWLLMIALVVIGLYHNLSTTANNKSVDPVNTAVSSETSYVAKPMTRRWIQGNRQLVEKAKRELFSTPLERYLAQFSEPGIVGQEGMLKDDEIAQYREVLNSFIYISDSAFTEEKILKRIVCGLKHEMKDYLEGGGTPSGYAQALVERQKKEYDFRISAENKLAQMEKNEKAYAFWLKANASLAAMGIQPIDLPYELYAFQMSVDLDADE